MTIALTITTASQYDQSDYFQDVFREHSEDLIRGLNASIGNYANLNDRETATEKMLMFIENNSEIVTININLEIEE